MLMLKQGCKWANISRKQVKWEKRTRRKKGEAVGAQAKSSLTKPIGLFFSSVVVPHQPSKFRPKADRRIGRCWRGSSAGSGWSRLGCLVWSWSWCWWSWSRFWWALPGHPPRTTRCSAPAGWFAILTVPNLRPARSQQIRPGTATLCSLYQLLYKVRKVNRDARGKRDRGALPVNQDHPDPLDLPERWGNRVDLDYPDSRDQIWPPVPSARPPTAPCPKSPFTQGSKNSTRATSCWSLTT